LCAPSVECECKVREVLVGSDVTKVFCDFFEGGGAAGGEERGGV